MPIGQTLEKRIQYRIKRSKSPVFMLADFDDLSDRNQVGRVLRKLVKKNLLVKAGQGVYVRAIISELTDEPIPEKDIRSIALDVLKKCKVSVVLSDYEKLYANGKTTQIPTGNCLTIKGRFSRKIGFGNISVSYAHAH